MRRSGLLAVPFWTVLLVAASTYPVLGALRDAAGWKKVPFLITGLGLVSLAACAWLAFTRPWPVLGGVVALAAAIAALWWRVPGLRPLVLAQSSAFLVAATALLRLEPQALNGVPCLWAQALVSFGLCVVLVWAVHRPGGPLPVLGATVLWFVYLWLNFLDTSTTWLTNYFIVSLPLIAVWRQAYLLSRHPLHHDSGSGYLSLALLAGVLAGTVALAGVVLPYDIEPFDLEDVGHAVERAFPATAEWRSGRSGGRCTLTEAGFGGSPKELGGPIRLRDDPVARVSIEPDDGHALYLRSEVWTTYTGKGWTSAAQTVLLPSGPRIDLPVLYPRGEAQQASLTVAPEAPSSAILVLTEPESLMREAGAVRGDTTGNLWLVRASTGQYTIRAGRPLPPPASPLRREPSERVPGMDLYLQLPADVTERTRALVARLTARTRNGWDAARRLEAFVRTIPYSTDPPRAPAGRDFVDHFLFDLRAGYCSYHSTALAVMCRIAGIPSRWVTGYLAPAGTGPRHVQYGNAHAWVEVFIPESGWLALEGTPAFGIPGRERAETPVVAPPASADAQAGGPSGRQDLFDEPDTGVPGMPPARRQPIVPALALVTLLGVGSRMVWASWDWERRYRRCRAASDFYLLYLRFLGAAGAGRLRSETPRDYLARLSASWLKAGEIMQQVTAEFETEFYGGTVSLPGEGRDELPWADLQAAARQRLGKARYWLQIFLLNTGGN
jgi:transglutaminase-like putative cysteine protease